MARQRWLKQQKLRDVNGDEESYQKFCDNRSAKSIGKLGNRFDFSSESPQANPDLITEGQALYADSQPNKAREIMGDAVEHLQGRQRDVYMMIMRQGLSFQETAKLLKISKSAVQIYKNRAVKFITAFCKNEMKKNFE